MLCNKNSHAREVTDLLTIRDTFDQILSVFQNFRFSDFIDIVLVAFLIYGIIRIVRETRAFQLLKGLALLGILYTITIGLKMNTSAFILGKIFEAIVIIVVVLFTPEIRHALEQIGKTNVAKLGFSNLLNGELIQANTQREKLIEAACRACASMSDKKIGALIVFEKEVLLGDIVATGTMLDAEPTGELIRNIFFPKSPLHDGAMIARDGKVYAAGCILPLTKNNAISSALGTRHRAALGVSEQSDAIVVVVSEETGVISVARGGVLRRNLSDGDVRDILTEAFISNPSEENTFMAKIKRRFKKS